MLMIVDNFVKLESFLAKLKEHEEFAGADGWWEGWWKVKPRNVWEELIQGIWSNYPDIENIKGFEWWTNAHTGKGLGWHMDKDEVLAEEAKYVFPEHGSIYYPYPHQIQGGMLQVEYDEDQQESIAPVHNRLVMFNPSRLHRVTKVYSGTRHAFVCNIWRNHKPLQYELKKNSKGEQP